jgi:lysine-specific demethylase 3
MSTELHINNVDMLNLITYTAQDFNGQTGCAVWDIFSPQDGNKIRQFLRDTLGLRGPDRLRAGKKLYLDPAARHALSQRVQSYRVEQRVGDAVLIPAGCVYQASSRSCICAAHSPFYFRACQVHNVSDCISVVINFVSMDSLNRGAELGRGFRAQNRLEWGRLKVLPLTAMMWFAWLSCCYREEH